MAFSTFRRNLHVRQAKGRIRSIPDPTLNQICSDLAERLHSDTGFVTFVDARRAYVVGVTANIPVELQRAEGIELNASFCAALVNSAQAQSGIVCEDTKNEPMLKYCPATAIYSSWVGAPVYFKNVIVGAIGVADELPRRWGPEALDVVREAAKLVEAEIALP